MTKLMLAMCRSSGEEDARGLKEAARLAAAPLQQNGGAGGVCSWTAAADGFAVLLCRAGEGQHLYEGGHGPARL